ncbi:MAG: hypothetical protein E6J87_11740, partial [Deltaproteobacteria bacterium]
MALGRRPGHRGAPRPRRPRARGLGSRGGAPEPAPQRYVSGGRGWVMDRIAVRGRGALHGEVAASGSKNSTLALMAGALLARGETHLSNVPRLRDVSAMLEILRALGARAQWHPDDDHAVLIDASTIRNPEAPYALVGKMRASFLVLGPLLARFGAARVS